MYYLIRTSFTKRRRFASFLCREYTAAEKQREQQLMTVAAGCRAEGAAVHSSVKRKRKKPGDFFFCNHFLNTVSLFDSWRSSGKTVAFKDFSLSFGSLRNLILYQWSKFRPNRSINNRNIVVEGFW